MSKSLGDLLKSLPEFLEFEGEVFWFVLEALDPNQAQGFTWMASYNNSELDKVPRNFYEHGTTPLEAVVKLSETVALGQMFEGDLL